MYVFTRRLTIPLQILSGQNINRFHTVIHRVAAEYFFLCEFR